MITKFICIGGAEPKLLEFIEPAFFAKGNGLASVF